MTGADSALRIAVLYPELLGTYGDGGNVLVLRQRLAWRGIAVEVVQVRPDQSVPGGCDLYVLGGGEDDAQTLALGALRRGGGLPGAVAAGASVFAVCAGLQLLGTSYRTGAGTQQDGLGLLDLRTDRLPVRAVGEVVVRPDPGLGLPLITGYENHGGATQLGPAAAPLGVVLRGHGNDGDGDGHRRGAGRRHSGATAGSASGAGLDGAVQGRIVATYLHGPVLARNPALADLLLERALGAALPPLEIPAVDRLRSERLRGVRAGADSATPHSPPG